MQESRLQVSRLQAALQVSVLLLVAVTALAYPFCFPADALSKIRSEFSANAFATQVLPWLSCGFTPLVLKECLFISITGIILFVFCWIKIRSQWLGLERPSLVRGEGIKGFLAKPETWAFILLLYLAVSLAWSPVFQQSLQTWILFASGIAVAIACRSEICGRGFAIKFMVLCVLCGTVVALLALLQHLQIAPLLPRSDDPRNRMSSLIGHNTGMSSWLMFPLSFAIYFVITNKRTWVKVLNAGLIALFVFIIIAAQSRAVWVLGLLLVVFLPLRLLRLHHVRPKAWVLVVAATLLTLSIGLLSFSPQINRLARLPVSLQQRVTGDILSVDQLRRETRLRILVVSMTELFPKAPLFGTGLGSFSWEYPKAQGEYFARNPESNLGTTTRRTDLAHNDYLQLLTETGLVGIILLGGTLITMWRDSRKRYKASITPYDKSAWWALTAPVIGVAIHGLVDFPFHVVPIAVLTLISACLATRLSCPAPEETKPSSPVASRKSATLIALATTVLLFSWLPWGWAAMVGRPLVSDTYFNVGQRYLFTNQSAVGQTLDHRLSLLDQSRRSFRQAVVANVFNGEAYEGQATAYVNKASYALHAYQQMRMSTQPTSGSQIQGVENLIENDASSAISVLENQIRAGGLRYHYTYYLLGRAWAILWELDKAKTNTSPAKSKAYANAVKSLETSLEFNPADSMTLHELSGLLLLVPGNEEKSAALRQLLFDKDPWAATNLILQPALDLAAAGEIAKAHENLDPIFYEMPNHPRVLMAKAWLAFYEAVWPPAELDSVDNESGYLAWRRKHLEAGRLALERLPEEDDYYRPIKKRLIMLYAAASGELETALVLATDASKADRWNREALAIKYWTEHKLNGEPLKLEDSVEYYRTRALLAIYFMDNRRSGLSLGELAFRQTLTLPEARRLTAFCLANGWTDFLAEILPQIRRSYPGDSIFAEQAEQLPIRG